MRSRAEVNRGKNDRAKRRRYGISQEVYEEMISAQGGRCLICRRKPDRLCVDHDHTSGAVRGLLCQSCNGGMGMFDDDPARMMRAVRYLMEA